MTETMTKKKYAMRSECIESPCLGILVIYLVVKTRKRDSKKC
jgi:hypothetical protein